MEFLSRHVTLVLIAPPLVVFFGVLVLFEVGRRLGCRRAAADPSEKKDDLGPVKTAIFGLLGLLIAFTFGGAVSRHDKRRDLAVQEAVAIGNAWDRIDALPVASRAPIRDGLRRYLESRLETYRVLPDLEAAFAELDRSQEIEAQVRRDAIAACATPGGQPFRLLIFRGLEAAFNLRQVRTAKAMHHPPPIIWLMLILLAFASALMAGYGVTNRRGRHWAYLLAFAVTTAITVYVTIDMEFPRAGLINLDASDRLLENLLDRMSAT